MGAAPGPPNQPPECITPLIVRLVEERNEAQRPFSILLSFSDNPAPEEIAYAWQESFKSTLQALALKGHKVRHLESGGSPVTLLERFTLVAPAEVGEPTLEFNGQKYNKYVLFEYNGPGDGVSMVWAAEEFNGEPFSFGCLASLVSSQENVLSAMKWLNKKWN